MRILFLASALLAVTAPAFAQDGKGGACKTYWEGCKDKKGKDKFQCMKDAATAAGDKACLDEMAKHKGMKHHEEKKDSAEHTD